MIAACLVQFGGVPMRIVTMTSLAALMCCSAPAFAQVDGFSRSRSGDRRASPQKPLMR